MKKILSYLLLISGFIFLNNLSANAILCMDDEVDAFRDKANEITVVYQLIDDESDRYFEVNILNVDPVFRFMEFNNFINFNAISDINYQLKRYEVETITKYSLQFFLKDSSCYYDPIRSINILVPRYNEYSELPGCQIAPDLKACQQTLPTNDPITKIELDEVEQAYQKYLAGNKSSDGINTKNNSLYLWIVIGASGIILVVILLIVIRNNKIKRRGVI